VQLKFHRFAQRHSGWVSRFLGCDCGGVLAPTDVSKSATDPPLGLVPGDVAQHRSKPGRALVGNIISLAEIW